MSRNRSTIDPRQLSIDFDAKIEAYEQAKVEILAACDTAPVHHRGAEGIEEIYIEQAAASKRAIRDCGLSREQVLDEINGYFRRIDGEKKDISIHMFNHYLSKPAEYPMPLHVTYALQRVTKSLEPTKAWAEAFDARVITREESRQMALGKLDETIAEMQRLKKELRGKR